MQLQKSLLRRTESALADRQSQSITIKSRLTGVGASKSISAYSIAHIADPHINMDLHPGRLTVLRSLLVQAIESGVSHIVISGDISTVPVAKHWIAVREMLRDLGVYHRDMVSLVIGNHDVFGGPHSTSDLLTFPQTCRRTNTDKHIGEFVQVFSELFRDTIHPVHSAFPYVKIVGSYAMVGMNSIAAFSLNRNAFASNGEVSEQDLTWVDMQMSKLGAYHKVVIVHHHMVNHKACFLRKKQIARRMLNWFEAKTLVLRDAEKLLALYHKYEVGAVLHGHVHVSTSYEVENILFSNAGGSVIPMPGSLLPSYNLLQICDGKFSVQTVTACPLKTHAEAGPASSALASNQNYTRLLRRALKT